MCLCLRCKGWGGELLFLEQLVGSETHDLTIAHDYKVAIIFASALDKAALGKENARVNSFLKFSYLKLTHNSKSFGRLTGQQPLLFRPSNHKQSF